MAAVSVITPRYDTKTGHAKMVIQGSNGDAYQVPWAPRGIDHSGFEENVAEIERPGRIPQIAVKAPSLHKMSFSFYVGRSIDQSCEADLRRLEEIVKVGGWVMILYGQRESGLWKVTQYSYSSIEREPSQNQISRANVTMSFTEVPDSRQTVAKYSSDFNFRDDAVTASIAQSIVSTAAATRSITTPTASVNNNAVSQPYVVQQGDTLLSVANKFFGQYGEQFWRVVGDVNKVVGQLNLGQILRIP